MHNSLSTALVYILFFVACKHNKEITTTLKTYKTTGSLEKFDESLSSIINDSAKAEIIAEGFDWSEGPLLINDTTLIFSDVPKNIVYRWTENTGTKIYLTPSGYTDTVKREGEMGSNGLTLNAEGKLILCQHGDRRMAKMNATLDNPMADFITIADKYDGKKFNSPNDATYNKEGDLFFTDPPYGLPKQMDDATKDIPYQGVYKVGNDGKVTLMVDTLTRPNGIAFFPDNKRVLVANSDFDKTNWYVFDYDGHKFLNGKIFYSLTDYDKSSFRGLPDGLKIDSKGNVFATGVDGLYIFNSDGKKLGFYKLPNPSSNCALSKDEKILYITNDMNILRLKLR
jgi:gluconolactonase